MAWRFRAVQNGGLMMRRHKMSFLLVSIERWTRRTNARTTAGLTFQGWIRWGATVASSFAVAATRIAVSSSIAPHRSGREAATKGFRSSWTFLFGGFFQDGWWFHGLGLVVKLLLVHHWSGKTAIRWRIVSCRNCGKLSSTRIISGRCSFFADFRGGSCLASCYLSYPFFVLCLESEFTTLVLYNSHSISHMANAIALVYLQLHNIIIDWSIV